MVYAPAIAMGVARAVALLRSGADARYFVGVLEVLDRLEYVYLVTCFGGGLFVLVRALAEVRSITARRQLRWIAWGHGLGMTPFALGYALPWAIGVEPSLSMQLSAIPLSLIPLAYASAIVRYRLTDVEVIVKRALVYAAAPAAVGVIYVVLLQGFDRVVSEGSSSHNWVLAVVVTVDRAAAGAAGQAHDSERARSCLLPRPLRLSPGAGRLRPRPEQRPRSQSAVRAARVSRDGDPARRSDGADARRRDAAALRVGSRVRIRRRSPAGVVTATTIGSRLRDGHIVALDDPIASSRFAAEDVEFWRDDGLYYFIPCVSNEGTIAVLALGRKDTGEPLSSEDTALLAAVAGQIATALENARLYRQLHLKAAELDRMRAFNENILESLDDGLLVVDLGDRVVRWNTALEELYGMPHASRPWAAACPISSTRRSSRRSARLAATRRTGPPCRGSQWPHVSARRATR